jgi:hypothetical protein
MRNAIVSEEEEAAAVISERILVTSEQQLYFRRIAAQSVFFVASTKLLRPAVVALSEDIELVDRGWVKFVVHLVASAVMHRFHKDAPSRARGEHYAADRIVAFFRRVVIRSLVSKVWRRTNAVMAAVKPHHVHAHTHTHAPGADPPHQGSSSSASGSPFSHGSKSLSLPLPLEHAPQQAAAAHANRQGYGHGHGRSTQVGSDAASVAGGGRSQRVTQAAGASSKTAGNYSSKSNFAVAGRATVVEKRRPFLVREVQTPTAHSLQLDMCVSIDSDDVAGAHLRAMSGTNEYSRLHAEAVEKLKFRYSNWANVHCSAYILREEEAAKTGTESGQLSTDFFRNNTTTKKNNHLYVANALRPGFDGAGGVGNGGAGDSSVHSAHSGELDADKSLYAENAEFPKKRQLIIHVSNRYSKVHDSVRPDERHLKIPVKAKLSVVEFEPASTDEVDSNMMAGGASFKQSGKFGMSTKSQFSAFGGSQGSGGYDGGDVVWDDRTIASGSINSAGVQHSSGAQPVIAYSIVLDGILPYSSYTVQVVFDEVLACELKEGNQVYFSQLEEENEELMGADGDGDDADTASIGSISEAPVAFSKAGRPWVIRGKSAADIRKEAHERLLKEQEELEEPWEDGDEGASTARSGTHGTRSVGGLSFTSTLNSSPRNSHNGAERRPDSHLPVILELKHASYTRPAIPRTIKNLAAHMVYRAHNVASMLASVAQVSDSSPPPVAMLHYSSYAPFQFHSALLPGPVIPQPQQNLAQKKSQQQQQKQQQDQQVASLAHADMLHGTVQLRWSHSTEDSHSNTHYEVQRRLLLIISPEPAAAKFKVPAPGANKSHRLQHHGHGYGQNSHGVAGAGVNLITGTNISSGIGATVFPDKAHMRSNSNNRNISFSDEAAIDAAQRRGNLKGGNATVSATAIGAGGGESVHEEHPQQGQGQLAHDAEEEAIYVGPWKHIAGLKTLESGGGPAPPGVSSSSSSSRSSTKANSKSHAAAASGFHIPLHNNQCSDKIAIPFEFDANPDAYNCVVGYLCAHFPGLVSETAERLASKGSVRSVAEGELSQGSGVGAANPAEAARNLSLDPAQVVESLLENFAESRLSIAYEYRLRAANSAGAGAFNTTSTTPFLPPPVPANYCVHDTPAAPPPPRPSRKKCIVRVARVHAQLGQLSAFRARHPKYRLHNSGLVSDLIAASAQPVQRVVEKTGDPFVSDLVERKIASLSAGGGDGAMGEDEPLPVAAVTWAGPTPGEDTELNSWLMSLELECPIK